MKGHRIEDYALTERKLIEKLKKLGYI